LAAGPQGGSEDCLRGLVKGLPLLFDCCGRWGMALLLQQLACMRPTSKQQPWRGRARNGGGDGLTAAPEPADP
jgi:hypothetical protein